MTAVAARRASESTNTGRRSVLSTRPSSRPASQLVRPDFMRPSLRVIDQASLRSRARRRTMALTTFIILLAGSFAVALVQAQLVANQHDLDLLRGRLLEAEADRARLARQVEEASAPGAIIEHAELELKMVRAVDPVYLAPVAPAPNVPIPIALVPDTEPAMVTGVEAATGDVEVAVGPQGGSADGQIKGQRLGGITVAASSGGIGGSGVVPVESSGESSGTSEPSVTPAVATIAGTQAVSGGLTSTASASTEVNSG